MKKLHCFANVVVRCSAFGDKQRDCRFFEGGRGGECKYKTDLNGTTLCLSDEAGIIAFKKLAL